MKQLTIPSYTEENIKKGRFVLEKQDFPSLSFHHQVVELVNAKGNFVGIGYLSEQNKGIGWFISHKKVVFDVSFFCRLFQCAKEKRQVYQQSKETTAYRLFNQEGDGFGGLTIDLYQEYAVFLGIISLFTRLKILLFKHFSRFFQKLQERMRKFVSRV